jgi:hypothetical protein
VTFGQKPGVKNPRVFHTIFISKFLRATGPSPDQTFTENPLGGEWRAVNPQVQLKRSGMVEFWGLADPEGRLKPFHF